LPFRKGDARADRPLPFAELRVTERLQYRRAGSLPGLDCSPFDKLRMTSINRVTRNRVTRNRARGTESRGTEPVEQSHAEQSPWNRVTRNRAAEQSPWNRGHAE
jgi:hypothetical protein